MGVKTVFNCKLAKQDKLIDSLFFLKKFASQITDTDNAPGTSLCHGGRVFLWASCSVSEF